VCLFRHSFPSFRSVRYSRTDTRDGGRAHGGGSRRFCGFQHQHKSDFTLAEQFKIKFMWQKENRSVDAFPFRAGGA
jgi:hypothetical protein